MSGSQCASAAGGRRDGRRALHRWLRPLLAAPLFAALLGLAATPAGAAAVEELSILTADSRHDFQVEIAATPDARAKGLMFRTALAPDAGMLFLFHKLQPVAFWMKNTELPLDMLFVDRDGRIVRIHERAVPGSLDTIESGRPVWAVLEVIGGTADRLHIQVGDRVRHRAFADGP